MPGKVDDTSRLVVKGTVETTMAESDPANADPVDALKATCDSGCVYTVAVMVEGDNCVEVVVEVLSCLLSPDYNSTLGVKNTSSNTLAVDVDGSTHEEAAWTSEHT